MFSPKFIELVKADRKVKFVVGVSGGVDSMVLLHLLKNHWQNVIVAHVNYHLRGEESNLDEELVSAFCEKNSIRFRSLSAGKKNFRDNTQQWARELRYSFFEEVRLEEGADFILTSHHQDDNIETILMALLKGKSVSMFTGMKFRSDRILRPLIDVKRSHIEEYAFKNEIIFREDESNKSPKYFRNEIRLQLIPQISDNNPDFRSNVLRLSEIASEINRDIETIFHHHFDIHQHSISVEILAKFSRILRNQILRLVFNNLGVYSISNGELFSISRLLKSNSGRKVMVGDIEVLKDRESLVFYSTKNKLENFPVREIIDVSKLNTVKADNDFVIKKVAFASVDLNNPEKLYLSIDGDILVWRNWQAGDVFQPLGMNGRKKVKKILQEQRVSLKDKVNVRVLEAENGIIAAIIFPKTIKSVGLISELHKISPPSKTVVQITRDSFE